ncbi:MAG: hypothetical protein RIC56_23045 [Pseudomonadales bacterium]
MSKVRNVLGWAGIVVLGLATGVLEDIIFITLMVPYFPPSWDLTGDLFWVFTVPLAQALTLAVTGTLAWFLGLRQPARLTTFWACWTVSRATLLTLINNPLGDVLVYLLWIALWCALIGVLARLLGTR